MKLKTLFFVLFLGGCASITKCNSYEKCTYSCNRSSCESVQCIKLKNECLKSCNNIIIDTKDTKIFRGSRSNEEKFSE